MRAFCTMLAAVVTVGATCGVRAQTDTVTNGVKAVVHDSVVTLGELQSLTIPAAQQLYQQYRDQREVYERKLAKAEDENLEELLERQLILHDFDTTFSQPELRAMVNKMVNSDVDRAIEAEIHERFHGDRVLFIKTLKANGTTLERHRRRIRDQRIVEELRRKNIPPEIVVSPKRVEAYYQAHQADYKVGEQVKLRMIVLKCPEESQAAQTRKLAEDILAKLKEGVPFVEMATTYSEGSQRGQGGDLGWRKTSSDRSLYEKEGESMDLLKHLADTAASLQPGQVSGVMSCSTGGPAYDDYWVCQYDKGIPTLARHYRYDTVLKRTILQEPVLENAAAATNLPPPVEFYLLLVEDRRPAGFVPLKDVWEKIAGELRTQDQKVLETQWIDRLKKRTFVRVF